MFFFNFRNPLSSGAQSVKVYSPVSRASIALITALMASGFRRIDNRTNYYTFQPCPVGTFSNSASRGRQGCTSCPPGTLHLLIIELTDRWANTCCPRGSNFFECTTYLPKVNCLGKLPWISKKEQKNFP